MRKNYDCPKCGKIFHTWDGTANHIEDVHAGVGEPRNRRDARQTSQPYESLADISVEAELKVLMGEPLDELEASLINQS